jgi:hypothetical protein
MWWGGDRHIKKLTKKGGYLTFAIALIVEL